MVKMANSQWQKIMRLSHWMQVLTYTNQNLEPISRHSIFLWQSLRRKKIQENLSSSSAMVLLDWKCWSRFECWLIWGNQNGIFITAATSNKTITQWYKEVHPKFWNDLPASQMVYHSFMTENAMNSRFEV